MLVGDGTVQRALVDVVVDPAAGPVDGYAKGGGIEKAASGDVFGSAGAGGGGREKEERQSQEGNCDAAKRAAAMPGGAHGRWCSDGHGFPQTAGSGAFTGPEDFDQSERFLMKLKAEMRILS